MTEHWAPQYRLEQEQFISRPRTEVFAFFSDAMNLERLTPPFLNFKVLTPAPIEMKADAIIDYTLSLYGVGFHWKTRIESFTPESSFVDTQERGPYALWHHTHTFEDAPGGTLMRDLVVYRLPLGPLGPIGHSLFVRSQLQRIFDYRRAAISEIFGVG